LDLAIDALIVWISWTRLWMLSLWVDWGWADSLDRMDPAMNGQKNTSIIGWAGAMSWLPGRAGPNYEWSEEHQATWAGRTHELIAWIDWTQLWMIREIPGYSGGQDPHELTTWTGWTQLWMSRGWAGRRSHCTL
jgi:hypothetical protein